MTVDWIPWASQGFCHTSEVTSRTGMGWGRRVGRSHGQLPMRCQWEWPRGTWSLGGLQGHGLLQTPHLCGSHTRHWDSSEKGGPGAGAALRFLLSTVGTLMAL